MVDTNSTASWRSRFSRNISERQNRSLQKSSLTANWICRGALASVMIPASAVSTCASGKLKFG
jgi:hypothetical protein